MLRFFAIKNWKVVATQCRGGIWYSNERPLICSVYYPGFLDIYSSYVIINLSFLNY